jgi:hypothetical protein
MVYTGAKERLPNAVEMALPGCHSTSQPAHLNEESLSVCRDRPGQQSTRDDAENTGKGHPQEDYTFVKTHHHLYS